MRYTLRLAIVVATLFCLSSIAAAGEHTDASGFSVKYPDDWTALSSETLAESEELFPQEIKNWLAKNHFDFNRVNLMLMRNGTEDFLENLNVLVGDQQIQINNESVAQLIKVLQTEYGAIGGAARNIRGKIQEIGSSNVIVIEYESELPGASFPLRQRQVYFPGGGKTYIITCTSKSDTFSRYAPVFDEILASVQVPAPTSYGFKWNRLLIMAAVGGAIGASVTVFRKVFGK